MLCARLPLTPLAAHRSVGREEVRAILATLCSYSLHRSVLTMRPLAGLLVAAGLVLSGCTTVRQGEIGVKRTLGRLDQQVILSGPKTFNPFLTTIIKVPVTTQNLEIRSNLPSKEGLSIGSDISILYRVKAEQVPNILQTTGRDYANILILPVFRSAAADVCARYFAKDMHSAERGVIETAIQARMNEVLSSKGFEIENVLMKNITLPAGLAKAIEDRLEAEQDALRMEFQKQRETRDAERRVIEAEGQKRIAVVRAQGEQEANIIQAKGKAEAMRIEAEAVRVTNQLINRDLTPAVLKFKSIEAFRELSKSQNSKTIITNGTTPVLNTLSQ
ncbi:Regulator of protease activity HflC, stomatin/prohibitin superfamily [Hymenobacter daecheongensis DSM 21074]|uniref:Regulator of protease activity HflC, stomatin/prohibitin superfamily n=2 Tax=Hymenobacter daecheongensis TaxID=496053 RepID=A0A1M6ELK1_9BACT|nr:Regulator of protease activity HflC, stomatin/prohibitin superfamily [Hymenobacter daecheongensis DSM 21074]